MKDSDDTSDPVDSNASAFRKTLHRRADEQLCSLKDPELEALGPEEIKQLVHEMRIHQIELEMQKKELQQVQARYLDLYDTAPVGCCTLSENGMIVESNFTAATLLGVFRDALIKKPFSNFILNDDQDIYYRHYHRLVETGIPQAFELRLIKNDETVFWARLNTVTLHDAANTPVFRIVLSDITEYRMAVEALRQSELRECENRFRKLFEQHSAIILILDAETGNIIDANLAAVQFYGWPIEKLKQMRIQEINTLPPEAVQAQIEIARLSEATSFEFRHRRADGSIREVEVRSSRIEIAGKTLLNSIIHDITDRKLAEKALRDEERYLHTILQTTADGFWVVDTEGKIIRVNEAYCRMSGYTRDELLKLDISAIDAVEEPAETLARIQRIIANKFELFEATHRRKDGSLFHVEVSATYMNTGDGKFVCFCRDITERKATETALQIINVELENRVEQRTRELQETQSHFLHAEKLSAIGKLSASIAHEFNNPLQGIMSILKGLKKRAILDEEDRELLDAAISESERMKNLIRSLQDFNRPSSSKKVMMDVHKSIDSLLLLCKSDFKNKQISVILNYAERLPPILAVPDQIKQVFLNLLANAADACLQPRGVITVSTWREEKRAAVAIKDTGVGIAAEKTEQIFQPFYTTKAAVKGTGLGLSVCHGIVQEHQGEIRVESKPGKGSTFTVLLPFKGS